MTTDVLRLPAPHPLLLDKLRRQCGEPVKLVVLLAVIVVLFALIVYPVSLLLKFSLTDKVGAFSPHTIFEAFRQPGMVKASVNTALLALLVTVGANILALPLAWLVARSDMPFKSLIRVGATLAFVIPSFITVIAWIFLASPNAGYLNKAARWLLGIEGPLFNVVSFGGLVFIEVSHLFPLIFFIVSAALSNIDLSQEQAARVLGAGKLRVAATITFPLVAPAIVSGTMLVFLDVISSFGAPAVIGTMANFSVLTTKIYAMISFPPRLELAAAASLPIVLITLFCLALQRRMTGLNRYRTLTGKQGAAGLERLGRLRIPAFLFCVTVIFASGVLPLMALAALSLLKAFGLELVAANLTLRNFEIIANPSRSVFPTVWHSLVLAAATAFICMVVGFLSAWFVERTSASGRGAVTAIIMITYGFPSIAFAVAVLLGYVDVLYGTFTILGIAYVAKMLPVSFVLFRSALKQLSTDLEEVARVLGSGWARTLLHISVPLMKTSAWAAALLVFAVALRELSMSAILTQPTTQIMSTKVMEYIETGAVELAAAMALLIVALSIAALVMLRFITGRSAIELKQ
ncbi:iron(III) transport system permease protein [Pararhizobium capsulatum DSM 1112]|uniref:Iron(III) transport system permease protein n=1 Tax=Pararhizobium capsulatum DSM 1112 TaxID=1121113 RepID=A0ABU0BZE0_9HYPH|nr:iron ABC transporter permease [Pararhizobium capsulatum]MDQ0323046.1 iron(III) transport system permease protein [Pararhizobium capsulatum DSM 1112]